MQRNWLIAGLTIVLLSLSLLAEAALPLSIVIESVQSVGGDLSFCPSKNLQQALIRRLSSNAAYMVGATLPQGRNSGVRITGIANCSLGQRQRQQGFLVFQQRSVITTAIVELNLQLINASSGATIATMTERGEAQVETPAMQTNPLEIAAGSEAAVLFEQATSQALDKIIPQINKTLAQMAL